MEQYKIMWDNLKVELEKKILPLSFQTWIEPLVPLDIHNKKLILSAPNALCEDVIKTKHFLKFKESLEIMDSGITDVEIVVMTKDEYLNSKSEQEELNIQSEFNPKYTFDSFVVGSSNQFLQAAARGVVSAPGANVNPLFIYGSSGLGKTHILHAIGNELKSTRPDLKVIYVTSEKFTNELIEFMSKSSKEKGNYFRAKYRKCDVLMVDDIQFISGKTATQEEFFNTFNELYSQNKQIIISSDRPPREIAHLEDRLKTRFEGGLTADVQPPNIETKIAILKKKAEMNNQLISDNILMMIADKVQSNVRELEGLLNRVIFLASLHGKAVSMEIAKDALKDYADSEKEIISCDSIIEVVCNYYKLNRLEIVGKKKNKEIVDPRQMAIYLINEFMSLPLAAIGQIFGGRDHTTVIHARDKISNLIKEGGKVCGEYKDLRDMILKK